MVRMAKSTGGTTATTDTNTVAQPNLGLTSEDRAFKTNLLTNDGGGTTKKLSACDTTSKFGATISWNADGTVNYNPTDPTTAAKLQALSPGEYLTDSFSYTITYGSGKTAKTSTATAYIVVWGENDEATITIANPAAVTESDTSALMSFNIASKVTVSDIDTKDAASSTPYVAGSGTVAVTSTGSAAAPTGTLLDLFSFDKTTGAVSYDRASFNWLDSDQTVTYTITFQAQSGNDTAANEDFDGHH